MIADVERVIDASLDEVKGYVDRGFDRVFARLAALESRKPIDGKSVSLDDVRPLIEEGISKAVATLPPPKEGKPGKSVTLEDVRPLINEAVGGLPMPKDGISVTIDDVAPLIADEVAKAVSALPTAKDGDPGTSVTIDDVRPLIAEAVAAMPKPVDGTSVLIEDVEPLIRSAVEESVSRLPLPKDGDPGKDVDPVFVAELVERTVLNIPKPQDGKSVTAAELQPLIAEAVAKAVGAIPSPKDGVGIASALIGRDGELLITASDGKLFNLGRVDGRPGVDGLGFDDLQVEFDGKREFKLCCVRGDQRKELGSFTVPVQIYCGIYKEGVAYERGDTVTWGGSQWHCEENTIDKPGDGSKSWRLSVKKGRDGKDGIVKHQAPPKPIAVNKSVPL